MRLGFVEYRYRCPICYARWKGIARRTSDPKYLVTRTCDHCRTSIDLESKNHSSTTTDNSLVPRMMAKKV